MYRVLDVPVEAELGFDVGVTEDSVLLQRVSEVDGGGSDSVLGYFGGYLAVSAEEASVERERRKQGERWRTREERCRATARSREEGAGGVH